MNVKIVSAERLLLALLVLSAAGCAAGRAPESAAPPAASAPPAAAAEPQPTASAPAPRTFSSATEEQRLFAEKIRREGVQPPMASGSRTRRGAGTS
ncbi:MAG: hypothetical protein M5U13_00135 [Thermoanaerobaculia bacterium]|nr:hypothetical protein [Thermoanaerobaculia bacterium]